MSADNKLRFHLPDGPEQQARDAAMASGSTDWSLSAIGWVYAHDAGVLGEAADSFEAIVRAHASCPPAGVVCERLALV